MQWTHVTLHNSSVEKILVKIISDSLRDNYLHWVCKIQKVTIKIENKKNKKKKRKKKEKLHHHITSFE